MCIAPKIGVIYYFRGKADQMPHINILCYKHKKTTNILHKYPKNTKKAHTRPQKALYTPCTQNKCTQHILVIYLFEGAGM